MEKDNQLNQKGFHYTVTDEQIREHQKKTVEEVFEWLETTNEFLFKFQTPEERKRMMQIRNGEF